MNGRQLCLGMTSCISLSFAIVWDVAHIQLAALSDHFVPAVYFVRFEVGVRVEGFAVGGERRHINSAFFIYRPRDESVVLPKLIPDSQV